MKKWLIVLLAAVTAAGLFAINSYAADRAIVCSVLNMEGTATVTNAAGTEKPVKKGDELHEGDFLEVGLSSYVDLQYDNNHRNVSRIEADSEVTIKQLTEQDLKLNLKLGGVYAKLKALPTNGAFEVQTPLAIAGVRGSKYRTTHRDDDGTKVYNYSESKVTVSSVDANGNAAGNAVTLENMQKTQIAKAGEALKVPEKMTAQELEQAGKIETDVNKAVGMDEAEKENADRAGEAEDSMVTKQDTAKAEQALMDMANAYQNEDAGTFFSYMSDDFPSLGELEEFVKRDFTDYDGMKLSIFISRSVKIPGGVSIKADWQLQYQPSALSTQLTTKGENLEFVFANENGRYKLKAMRGPNPLFGARSPDIASLAGVPSSITKILELTEDEANRSAKQAAMLLISSDASSQENELTPVTIEIVSLEIFNGVAGLPLPASTSPGTYRPQIKVRIADNPNNVVLHGVTLEVFDSRTQATLSGTGDILPGVVNTIRTSNSFSTATATDDGRLTFVLDPRQQFNIINRSDLTASGTYDSP